MPKSFDNAGQVTTTTGTGTITLGNVIESSYHTFAEQGAADGDIVYYRLDEGGDLEIGIGTYSSTGPTISRDTVLSSRISGSDGTTKMTLAGAAQVVSVVPAEVIEALDGAPLRVDVVDTTGADPTTAYEAGDTLDGETLVAGWVVLRATSSGNASDGAYVVPASGAAPRHSRFDTYDAHCGALFSVLRGTYAGTEFRGVSAPGGTLDTTALTFERRPIGPNMTAAEQRQALKNMGAPNHKISQASISAGQYIEFTGLDWGEYPNGFEIVLLGALPTTDNASLAAQEDAGAGYLTGAADYNMKIIDAVSTTPGAFGSARDTIDLARGAGNAVQEMISGSIRIYPQAGGATAWYEYKFNYRTTDGEVVKSSGSGKRVAQTAVPPSKIRLFFDPGGNFIGQGSTALIGYF